MKTAQKAQKAGASQSRQTEAGTTQDKPVSRPKLPGADGTRSSKSRDEAAQGKGAMNVPPTTLNDISTEVDRLWSDLKRNRAELQTLIYSAWRALFAGRKGRPKDGGQSFTEWLDARTIPRRTGYNFLNREKLKRGERIVPVGTTPEGGTQDDDVQEEAVEKQKTPQASSGNQAKPTASSKPLQKSEPVDLKESRTPAFYKKQRTTLEQQFRQEVGEAEADRILDKVIVDFLLANRGKFPNKANMKAIRRDNAELIQSLKAQTTIQQGGR